VAASQRSPASGHVVSSAARISVEAPAFRPVNSPPSACHPEAATPSPSRRSRHEGPMYPHSVGVSSWAKPKDLWILSSVIPTGAKWSATRIVSRSGGTCCSLPYGRNRVPVDGEEKGAAGGDDSPGAPRLPGL